ncbi:MAG: hypothetical protein WCK08_10875 [Betaproteobacteria bacterium]
MNLLKIAAVLIWGLLLVACGGGGGCSAVSWALGSGAGSICEQGKNTPNTTGIAGALSGVAAGGAPIIGNVEVTDSLGVKRGVTIEADGRYAVDVQGMTGPFVIKAGGRVGATWVTYYSVALASDVGGTINITPFTDIIVSSLAGTVADKFGNGADSKSVNSAKIESIRIALYQKLYPLLKHMGIEDGIDFLRSVFNADHTKLDALFDVLQVQTDEAANTIILKDFINNTTLGTIDVTQPIDSVPILPGTLPASAADDIRQIVQAINDFTARFANQLPTPKQLAESGLIDTSSDFMNGGQSFEQWADELSSNVALIGWKIVSIDVKIKPGGLTATATGAVQNSQGVIKEEVNKTRFVKKQGRWLFQGDGLIADVGFKSAQTYDQNSDILWSGISFGVDPFAYNNGRSVPVRVATASVTGPGLSSPLWLAQDVYDTWLGIATPGELTSTRPNAVGACPAPYNGPCLITSEIANNSIYNLILKDASGNTLNDTGYNINLGLAPLPTSSLSRAMFGTIDRVTINGKAPTASAFAPHQSLLVNFTLPDNRFVNSLQVQATGVTGLPYFRIEKPLLAGNTSVLIGWTAPENNVRVSSLHLRLCTYDVNGRKFATDYSVPIN